MTTITLLSWNVNGARAIHRAGFLPWLAGAAPDILCLQETRCDAEQLPAEMRQPPGYQAFWHGSERKKGYSGTALLTRMPPESVRFGLGDPQFDDEGRTIVADYRDFTLINCYFPNGSRDHSRVPYKLAFYDAFLALCERLRAAGRPVIFCGDVNTAHREIDLARPRENRNTTGFLPEERAWMDTAGRPRLCRHPPPLPPRPRGPVHLVAAIRRRARAEHRLADRLFLRRGRGAAARGRSVHLA